MSPGRAGNDAEAVTTTTRQRAMTVSGKPRVPPVDGVDDVEYGFSSEREP
jgi:hypothetical protein